MNGAGWFAQRGRRLSLIAGVCDGILTALILTTGRLLHPAAPMTLNLALRVASGALASGAFVFFVAQYAELRGELIHAERQLNLTTHGRFATTQLGRAVLHEALVFAALASLCAFIGALIPLLMSVLLPAPPWLSVAITIAVLGMLGVSLARAIYTSALRWSLALMFGGSVLACLGAVLHIV